MVKDNSAEAQKKQAERSFKQEERNQLMMTRLQVHFSTFDACLEHLSTDARSIWQLFHAIRDNLR